MEEPFSDKIKRFAENLEKMTVDVIYDKRRDFASRIYAAFLRCLSLIFSAIVQLRYKLYRNRVFKDSPLGCFVIVVGNLTVGGTGKTPVVEKFAKELTARGRKVAILSRGYKSKSLGKFQIFWRMLTHGSLPEPKVVSDGEHVFLDSEMAGDEPFMLAKNLPGVVVIVDKNRVKAGAYAIRRFGVDTIILDDGFQYLPLKGQMQVLLVDKTNPFGNKALLPRGILREPVRHLKRASYIFLTKSDGNRDYELENFIRRYNSSAEFIECTHRPTHFVDFANLKHLDVNAIKGRRVAYFCAIAAPESFEKFLREMGASIVHFEHFIDHHRFTETELNEFFDDAKASNAELVVTTEKDAVRIDAAYKPLLPFYYSRLEIEILSGDGDFSAAVERLCFKEMGASCALPKIEE